MDSDENFITLCNYRPPSTVVNVFTNDIGNLIDFLKDCFPLVHELIIGGDFNIDLLNNNVHNADVSIDQLISYYMYPCAFVLTRPSSRTLLDNVFLSWPGVCGSYVLSVDISDHMPIIARFTIDSKNLLAVDRYLSCPLSLTYWRD